MDTPFPIVVVAGLLSVCIVLFARLRRSQRETQSLDGEIRQLRASKTADGEMLAIANERLRVLMDTVIDPVIFVNSNKVITDCNRAASQLTKGIAAPSRSLMESIRSYELDSLVDETLNGKQELPRDITVNERLYRVRLGLLSQGDQSDSVIMILRDVSDLQRLGRARRDFVANISHELRTPLTAIRLLVDTMRMSRSDDAELRQRHLNQIGLQVDTLTQLAQEMYDLSVIESGQVPMRMVRTPVRVLVDLVIAQLAPQAERVSTTLVNLVGDNVSALIDPDQISRVLMNLVHNAIKFTSNGQVAISVSSEQVPQAITDEGQTSELRLVPDDYITIEVRDTGAGIRRIDTPRIFERFYKVNRARGQGGTGLGLAIAKHIVEAHGGRIWVNSIEGKGASFYFTVPRDE